MWRHVDAAQADASLHSFVHMVNELVGGPLLQPSAAWLPLRSHSMKLLPNHVLIRDAYPLLYKQCKTEEMQGLSMSGQMILGVPGIGMEMLPLYLIKR